MCYDNIDSFLTSLGFTKSKADSSLYYKIEEGNPMILLLYVDYLFVTSEDGLIADMKRKLATEFKMKDLGMMHYFLGMEVWQNVDGIFLWKGKYEVDTLNRFKMMDCKAMTTSMASNLKLLSDASSETVDFMMYRQIICSLMYLMNTRPNIFFDVNTLRHFHLITTNHILRYLKDIVEYDLKYDTNTFLVKRDSQENTFVN